MHKILNIKTDDCRGAFYAARPSALGNPYEIGRDGDRNTVIHRYLEWLKARIAERDPVVCTALLGIRPGQPLSCHCAPAPCHAQVIADLLDNGLQDRLRATDQRTFRYAGIGSRETPLPAMSLQKKIAARLSERGYTLLSGGADGADAAFESGCFGKKEIFLPWPGFNHFKGRHCVTLPSSEAFRVAATLHPGWSRLKESVQALMARNSHQILGADLRSPVDFVVCWTRDGCEQESERSRSTGGTGQAITLASRWGIPVINLARSDAMGRLTQIVTAQ